MGALAAGAAYVLMPAPGEAAVNSLEEAFVQAYRTNPTLLAQRAALRAVDENVNQAVSGWKPRVTASASYQVSDEQVDSVIFEPQFGFDVDGNGQLEAVQQSTETDATTLNYGVTIDQNVFRGFRTLNETRQAKANVQAAREQLKITEIQVLLDTVTAYMDVLRDEAVVRLSTNNVQVLSRQLEAAQDRFRVGEITRTDVAQAEARLSGAQSNLISAEAQLTNSRAAFEQVVGETPGGLIAPPELPALPGTEDEAENIALQQNPNLRSAKQAEEASRYAIRVARGALLPTVTLQAGYQVSDRNGDTVLTRPFQGVVQEFPNPVDDRDTDIASITVNVNVPLYQAGAEYSALRQAKQLNSEDKLQIVEAERNVVQQIANTWEALRSARATIQASREQVRANEIAFEGVQQEAQVGSRTTLDVLDAEQELLDSRVTLVTAERDEYVAAFQLLAATGFLTANRLNIQAPIYDPNDHYDKARSKWIGVGQRDDFR
ncbi:MAG: TolC family outer membrane protein [Alphaproteobacteria bacterium]